MGHVGVMVLARTPHLLFAHGLLDTIQYLVVPVHT